MKKSLSDWASIAEIVGAAAIVVSLIFVGLEIRASARQTQLNTQVVQASALQQHFDQHASLQMTLVAQPGLLETIGKGEEGGLESLTESESEEFLIFETNNIRNHFVAHELVESGLLPGAQGMTFEVSLQRRIQRSRGLREVWELLRPEFSESFRVKVDAYVREVESGESSSAE